MKAINSKNTMKQTILTSMLLFLFLAGSIYSGEKSGKDGEGASVNSLPSSMLSYEILQSSPVKYDPTTLLSYSIPKRMDVTITLYDNNGMSIKTLVDEQQNEGSYNIALNSADLKNGIYYYQLTIGSYNEVKKIMLVN